MQITNNIFMVRPKHFTFNYETANNNFYQNQVKISSIDLMNCVLIEFDKMLDNLVSKGISVDLFHDKQDLITPDSIFPNNWISMHKSGEIVLYPMFAKNRKIEIRADIIDTLTKKYNFSNTIDLRENISDKIFLEGTGSMVLDRKNRILYASISQRTNKKLLERFSKIFNYKMILFNSLQKVKNNFYPIYHTNVMMSIGDDFCIICLDSITDLKQKKNVILSLEESKKKIICISEKQKNNFAGNMLQLKGKYKTLVMSKSAYNSLEKKQINELESFSELLVCEIDTIEKIGGGSVRCMIAEIFSNVS